MEKTVKLYIDCPYWFKVKVDDFLISIGKTKSNSVYHVAEIRPKEYPEKRIMRYYLKCFKSDLMTALKKDPSQKIIPLHWYGRDKKNNR